MQTLGSLNAALEQRQLARQFAAFAITRAVSNGLDQQLASLEQRLGPRATILGVARSAVGAMTTGGQLGALQSYGRAFLALVAQRSILGRLSNAPRVPLATRVTAAGEGIAAGYVGEGRPIPVAAFDLATTTLEPVKLGILTIVSHELGRSVSEDALTYVEQLLVRSTARGEDAVLLDGGAAIETVRPASILSGLLPVGGGSPTMIEEDVAALVTAVREGEPEAPVFIVSVSGALYLASLRSSNGTRLFPDILLNGGSLLGAPVLVSRAAGNKLVLLDEADLAIADGGVEVDSVEAADVEMRDTPTQSGVTGSGAQMVSLWQNNLTGVRTLRYLNWALGHSDGAAYLELPLGSPA